MDDAAVGRVRRPGLHQRRLGLFRGAARFLQPGQLQVRGDRLGPAFKRPRSSSLAPSRRAAARPGADPGAAPALRRCADWRRRAQRKRLDAVPSAHHDDRAHRGTRRNDSFRRHHGLLGNQQHSLEQMTAAGEGRRRVDARLVGEQAATLRYRCGAHWSSARSARRRLPRVTPGPATRASRRPDGTRTARGRPPRSPPTASRAAARARARARAPPGALVRAGAARPAGRRTTGRQAPNVIGWRSAAT